MLLYKLMSKEFENNAYFWQKVDAAFISGDYNKIYEKGSRHPLYPGLIFPVDYGHITTNDDELCAMKVFMGKGEKKVQSVVVCANLLEKDLSAILLIGLEDNQEEEVLKFLNSTEFQKAVVFRRGKDIPAWAVVE